MNLEEEILKIARLKIKELKHLIPKMITGEEGGDLIIPFAGPDGVVERLYFNIPTRKFTFIEYPIDKGDYVEYRQIFI